MMDKRIILDDISSLIKDIGKCTCELIEARHKHDDGDEVIALSNMESLMVKAHQEFCFLYDYIKEVVGDDDTKYTGTTDCNGKKNIKWPAW